MAQLASKGEGGLVKLAIQVKGSWKIARAGYHPRSQTWKRNDAKLSGVEGGEGGMEVCHPGIPCQRTLLLNYIFILTQTTQVPSDFVLLTSTSLSIASSSFLLRASTTAAP